MPPSPANSITSATTCDERGPAAPVDETPETSVKQYPPANHNKSTKDFAMPADTVAEANTAVTGTTPRRTGAETAPTEVKPVDSPATYITTVVPVTIHHSNSNAASGAETGTTNVAVTRPAPLETHETVDYITSRTASSEDTTAEGAVEPTHDDQHQPVQSPRTPPGDADTPTTVNITLEVRIGSITRKTESARVRKDTVLTAIEFVTATE